MGEDLDLFYVKGGWLFDILVHIYWHFIRYNLLNWNHHFHGNNLFNYPLRFKISTQRHKNAVTAATLLML